jgi:hypothetical protein
VVFVGAEAGWRKDMIALDIWIFYAGMVFALVLVSIGRKQRKRCRQA